MSTIDATCPMGVDLAERRTWSLRTSFWVVVGAQVLLLAASNFPTPLFPIYAHRYGFGSGVITSLFGIYVLVLIPTLLTVGRLADRLGRRPLLISGIAITALSSLAFAVAHSVVGLFAGEIVYGVGGGLVMSSAAVTIRELHPRGDVAAGARAGTLANAAGLTLGPLVSGFLATVTPWPTVSPYVLDIVLATLLVVALFRIPETRPEPTAAAPAVRTPLVQVPAEIRAVFVATAVAGAASWMALGWVFGLSPSFLHVELGVHITQPVVAGLFAALVVVANGIAQVVFRRHTSVLALRVGLAAIVVGMALVFGSMIPDMVAIALVGAVVAGAGTGVVQMHTMGTIQRIAPLHARGGVTSAFFTTGYLAMSIPVVVAGFVADQVGLGTVTVGYLGLLAALVGTGLALTRVGAGAAGEAMAAGAELVPDIFELEELEESLADA